MSRELIQTTLPGYTGPLEVNVSRLMDAGRKRSLRGADFQELAARFGTKVISVTRPTTDDGYTWFWALEFSAGDQGVVTVAFPWHQDWDEKDGSDADRSIAVYSKGSVTLEQASAVVEQLSERFFGLC